MFLFCLFILCTSSTPPCEWTRCLSVCRQMEGLFPQFNEGRLLGAYPQLPWSLICSWGVHWHCLVSMEGTDPEAGWRASWQTAFHWMWTIGGTGKFVGPPCWVGQDKQGQRLDWVKCVTGRETKLLTWVFFSVLIKPYIMKTISSAKYKLLWNRCWSPVELTKLQVIYT